MAGILKDAWLDLLEADEYFPDDKFVNDGVNLDAFVENDFLNWGIIGAPPNVQVNPVYPLPAPVQRTDTPVSEQLDEFTTDQTVVTDAEQVALAYDKLSSHVMQHKEQLKVKMAERFMWDISPNANTPQTPILLATGVASPNDGRASVTLTDIENLAYAFDAAEYPDAGRTLILDPAAFRTLTTNNQNLLNQYAMFGKEGSLSGKLLHLYGFDIIKRTSKVAYATGLTKNAYTGTPVAGTDGLACVAYIAKSSFGHCLGTAKVYDDVDNPAYQGTIISSRKRGMVRPFAQKKLGAIVRV